MGTHYKDTTISMRKTGAGKVSHSDVNVQKTNDKASPALDGVKGEAKEDHHKDVIHYISRTAKTCGLFDRLIGDLLEKQRYVEA